MKTTTATNGPSLNVYKKIAVIRKPSDSLTYEDAEGNLKSVSAEQLGDAIATATPLTTTKPKHDIPVPLIRKVGSYESDVSSNYKAPLSYVRCHRPTPEELKQTLEYVVDAEDETWLQNNSKFGGAVSQQSNNTENNSRPQPRLSLELFERMIDILEKETGFDSIITTNKAEDVFRAQIPEFFRIFPPKPRNGVVATKHVLNDVYTYWMQKRSRLKRPLFRRFWPVTSLDDTNPHLVFRPREKEKYKLRKKRQNDMDAYRKLKQLRQDFDTIRAIMSLIREREKLSHQHLKIQIELYRQRMYNLLDTSGEQRKATLVTRSSMDELIAIPTLFDTQVGGRNKNKNARSSSNNISGRVAGSDLTAAVSIPGGLQSGVGPEVSTTPGLLVAGQNHGQPAPSFLDPLPTRDSYVTSWDGAVPHVSSYVNSHPDPTHTFRYRPRVGRGGRICIDRLPRPPHPDVPPITVFTAGKPLPLKASRPGQPSEETARLLDLLPRPLDAERTSQRLEELCMVSIYEDQQQQAMAVAGQHPLNDDENDGDEVMVRYDMWLDTDEQLWGDERHSLGPLL
ncbi:hypothetical protein ACA910_018240 [Epithemia clementina (nom. ined.)]